MHLGLGTRTIPVTQTIKHLRHLDRASPQYKYKPKRDRLGIPTSTETRFSDFDKRSKHGGCCRGKPSERYSTT